MSTAKFDPLLPAPQDIALAKMASALLARRTETDPVQLKIKTEKGLEQNVPLPKMAVVALTELLSEMAAGNAIALRAIHQELSTFEAATMLNVRHLYLLQLLDENALPYENDGSQRRIRLADLLNYREQVQCKRYEVLDELSALSQENDPHHQIFKRMT